MRTSKCMNLLDCDAVLFDTDILLSDADSALFDCDNFGFYLRS